MFSTENFIRLRVRILWTQDHRDECLGLRVCQIQCNTHPNIHKLNLHLVNVIYCSMEQEMDPGFETGGTSARVWVVRVVIKVELEPHFVVLPSCRCILELHESIKWMYRYIFPSSNNEKETPCSRTQKCAKVLTNQANGSLPPINILNCG